MRRTELRHELQGLLNFSLDFCGDFRADSRIAVRVASRLPISLSRKSVMRQEAARTKLQGRVQLVDGLLRLLPFRCQQAEAFVRQWTLRRQLFRRFKVSRGRLRTVYPHEHIPEAKINYHRRQRSG